MEVPDVGAGGKRGCVFSPTSDFSEASACSYVNEVSKILLGRRLVVFGSSRSRNGFFLSGITPHHQHRISLGKD
jgi:hypothetical protein